MPSNSVSARRPPPQKRKTLSWKGLWYNIGFRNLLLQVLVIAIVLGCAVFMFYNAQLALKKLNIATGFGFLSEETGFDIGESLIPFNSTNTFLRAFGVALLNTLNVSVIAIVLATIIGLVIGIARMSSNKLISGIAGIYVEVLRNTPQLVQIIFWYALIVKAPHPREAISLWEGLFISNRGINFAWPTADPIYKWMGLALLISIIIAFLIVRFSDYHRKKTGRITPTFWLNAILIIGTPLLIWIWAGTPLAMDVPEFQGFNFSGGLSISPEFLAILLGLSLYISAFIAEIVRSGVQSIDKGQWEAAGAIGLNSLDRYRYIILPQALRVMIPPAGSQYVSLVKNSSLGTAIGYPELFNVTNSIVTNSANTIEPIAIMMAVYLTISFCIAIIINLFNKAVEIRER